MTSRPKVAKMLNCAPPLLEHLCYPDVVGGARAGWAGLFLAILGSLSGRVKCGGKTAESRRALRARRNRELRVQSAEWGRENRTTETRKHVGASSRQPEPLTRRPERRSANAARSVPRRGTRRVKGGRPGDVHRLEVVERVVGPLAGADADPPLTRRSPRSGASREATWLGFAQGGVSRGCPPGTVPA